MTSSSEAPIPSRIVAIVPIGRLDGAKSRLGAVLDAEERYDLVRRLAATTIGAICAVERIDETIVITPDDDARALALELDARPVRQRTVGLNAGLREAREEAMAGGAQAILIVPIDLPDITTEAVDRVLDRVFDRPPPLVGIVPDRHGRGTNALYLEPPDVIDVQFGGDSCSAHVAAASAAGAAVVEIDGPLAHDLDTPDDLLIAQRSDPRLVHG